MASSDLFGTDRFLNGKRWNLVRDDTRRRRITTSHRRFGCIYPWASGSPSSRTPSPCPPRHRPCSWRRASAAGNQGRRAPTRPSWMRKRAQRLPSPWSLWSRSHRRRRSSCCCSCSRRGWTEEAPPPSGRRCMTSIWSLSLDPCSLRRESPEKRMREAGKKAEAWTGIRFGYCGHVWPGGWIFVRSKTTIESTLRQRVEQPVDFRPFAGAAFVRC